MTHTASQPSTLARYGTVVVVGYIVELAIALILSRLVGLRLESSAALSFLTALAVNYALFEFWVFSRHTSTFSASRLLQTIISAGAALCVRVCTIWLVGKILGDTIPEVVLTILLGAAASMVVNYRLLNVVFVSGKEGNYLG